MPIARRAKRMRCNDKGSAPSTPWGSMMKRMHRKKLSLAVAQAVSAGVVVGLAAPAAYAQERIEKLTVTGSRLPVSPNLESTSPINIITSPDIKFEHPVSPENLLGSM